MAFPVIRLEIESMRHTIKTALTQYEMQLDADIQNAVDLYCSSDNIQSVIYRSAQEEIDGAIKDEIRKFFTYGKGREVIRQAVNEILSENIE